MSDNLNNPREYDAVLGNQNVAPINAAVLGRIEKIKQQVSTQVVEHRILALSEVLNCGEEGLALVVKALNDSEKEVHQHTYQLLKDRSELEVKTALDKYVQCYFVRFDGFYQTSGAEGLYFSRFYQNKTFFYVDAGASTFEITNPDLVTYILHHINPNN